MNDNPKPFDDVRLRGFRERTQVADVLRLIDSRIAVMSSERVGLGVAAGRVLASPVVAAVDVPGFDRSAMDGFALRDKIKMDAKLQLRCIPYLFFSTAVSQNAVIKAYSLSVQGFFIKQTNFEEIKKTISVIMEYWKRCVSPNNFANSN